MELNIDGDQAFQQNIRTFRFAETRSILIHTDYETAQRQGQRFVKMYVDTGNNLPFYETNENRGILSINNDATHKIQINLWDIYNNNSQVNFEIKGSQPVPVVKISNGGNSDKAISKLFGNHLIIKAPAIPDDLCAYMYSNRMRYQLDAAYQLNQTAVFIWDMDQGLPDSLSYAENKMVFNYKAVMPGASSFNYYGEIIDIKAPSNALFDTVFLSYDYALDTLKKKEEFIILKDIYPIRRNITITLKPKLEYSDQEKTSVYALDNRGNPSFTGGEWNGNNIQFKTRNWGTYTILADTVKPNVKALILNKDQLVFRIDDSLSGIDEYRLSIDDKWVLMNYDYKKKLLRSEKLDPSLPFDGPLELKVTDNAGNVNIYRTKI